MKNWTVEKIRKAFLDYFSNHDHKLVASSSLTPEDDPTLLFTNAGMVQFKGAFLGKENPKHHSVVTVQRCMRASGKHNDLENVGFTTRHHTFFEMLGSFSFGGYFKREAIHYAWEFLIKELGIDSSKLWITVHADDKESEDLWQKEFKSSGYNAQGIGRCGDEENFWSMGDTGPCGYCTEIFYDHGEHLEGDPPGSKKGGGDEGRRYVEIWNVVFMQFERDVRGDLNPLPTPSVDTGMGLERIAAVMQNVHDNYEIDIFVRLHDWFIESLGKQFEIGSDVLKSENARVASRVIADHIRASVFLIAEGIVPSNEKSGYVLRSIIRRAVYYLYRIGVRQPFFFNLAYPLIEMFDGVYPEIKLKKLQNQIASVIEQEEVKFLDTLDRGLKIFEGEVSNLKEKTIPGSVAFNLHDTYGLPMILTTELARERGLRLDKEGFDKEMEKQRNASRAASKFEAIKLIDIEPDNKGTDFLGYTDNESISQVTGLFTGKGLPVDSLKYKEEGILVLDRTPFYGESGGQVGDTGEIHTDSGSFIVKNTQKQGGVFLHYGFVIKGFLEVGNKVTAQIDEDRRQAIKLSHSATHLLHSSLRLVLGEGVMQKGSYVDDKRLRFDFTHSSPLSFQELREVERIVNSKIRANMQVRTVIKSLEDAKSEGALALFGERYTDRVRVLIIDKFSKELCGGTHVDMTGEIGLFKIISEVGVAAGIRRIEAVTGENALTEVEKSDNILDKASKLLGVIPTQIFDKTNQLIDEKKVCEKELSVLKDKVMVESSKDLINNAIKIGDIGVLSVKVPSVDSKNFRKMLDSLREKINSGVVVLAAEDEGKIKLIAGVTKDLIKKVKANELVNYITKKIDGSGGGRDDMAQGGGVNVKELPKALSSVVSWVKEKL